MRKKDEDKERYIKEAVVKLIIQEGFHGTSISKIAKLAGVSPATLYIYYENKDTMLHNIYAEYSEEILNQLLTHISWDMSGSQMIETLIYNYYHYIEAHPEIFSFVEQFSSCPSLANSCQEHRGISQIMILLDEMKEKHILKNYSTKTIISFIFYPIKSILTNPPQNASEKTAMLQEMIQIIQEALLI